MNPKSDLFAEGGCYYANSSTRKLEQEGYIYLENGSGRDMHLYLTPSGRRFAETNIIPVIRMEEETFLEMTVQERSEMVRLTRKYVTLMKESADCLLKNIDISDFRKSHITKKLPSQ